MSAAGPAIWRTIGLRLAAPSLRPTTLLELAPLRRWSQSRQLWTQRPQKAPSSIAPQLLFTRFSAAAKRHFQIGVSQIKNPLPSQDASDLRHLSFGELQTIFSGPTSVETGNKLLQELQSQRVSGTLDEGIADESETATAEALAWLRKNVPWDEDASINARLDREEEEERTKLVARAERLGLYKSQVTADHVIDEPLPSNEDNPLVYTPQQDTTRNKRLGTSVLQTIRKRNERRSRIEAKAKLKAEETARSEAIKAGLPVTQEEKYLARKAENAVWKAEKMEQARSVFGGKEAQWPDLAPWQRLWPSALMTAGVVGISLLFANFYTPPPPQGRIWPDWPPAITTVGVLITMNVLVFLAWRIVPSQRFLYKHFMSVPGYPRATGLIGNIFSQQKFLHLAVNMVALWIFGTRLHEDIGRGPFLATYFATGAFSSFFSLAIHVTNSAFATGILGASGVICGLIATWCVVNKDKTVKIWGIPQEWTKDVPTLGILAVLILSEFVCLKKGTLTKPYAGTDFLAHLGGYGSGIVAGTLIWRRKDQKERRERMRRKDEKLSLPPVSLGKLSQ